MSCVRHWMRERRCCKLMFSKCRRLVAELPSMRNQPMKARLRLMALLAILGIFTIGMEGRSAQATGQPGQLTIIDNGGLFSSDGIRQAKAKFAESLTKSGHKATIETIRELPEAEAAKLKSLDAKDTSAVGKFWRDFAASKAKSDSAKG